MGSGFLAVPQGPLAWVGLPWGELPSSSRRWSRDWQEREYPTGTLPLPLLSEVLSPMSLNALLALLGYRIAGAIEMGVVAGHACEPMKRC